MSKSKKCSEVKLNPNNELLKTHRIICVLKEPSKV